MSDDLLIANVLPSQFRRRNFWLGRQAKIKECITIKTCGYGNKKTKFTTFGANCRDARHYTQ